MTDKDKFFMSFFKGFHSEPPMEVLDALIALAPGAVETEWHKDGDVFEVIFREEGIEKIAFFSPGGDWLNTKENLTLETIPAEIRKRLEEKWEIMNAIRISTEGKTEFEFITRDQQKTRYLVFTDDQGNITHQSDFNEESIL
jgi:hypothetical protein